MSAVATGAKQYKVEGAAHFKLAMYVSETVLHLPSQIPLQEVSSQAWGFSCIHHVLGVDTIL